MSIIVYAESLNGKFKKSAFEVLSYGRALANKSKKSLVAISINADDPAKLSNYGPDKIISLKDPKLSDFTAQNYANVISEYSEKENISILILKSLKQNFLK